MKVFETILATKPMKLKNFDWPKYFWKFIKYFVGTLTNAGNPPGFPCCTKTAVELSTGSYGHLAIPNPIPGTNSDRGRCVKFDWKQN